MSLPRLELATRIADQLNELAAVVKTRSRASLTDASHILETIAKRFFNALYGWDLVNLNTEQPNYPAADLGDRKRRIAIQVTVQEGSDKISHTAAKAIEHKLGKDFDSLIVFFLLPKKPSLPKKFIQPTDGPKIETRDITDLLEELKEMDDLKALAKAAKVLDEEMGELSSPDSNISDLRRRLLATKDAHGLRTLLHEAEAMPSTPGTKLLIDEITKALDYAERPVVMASQAGPLIAPSRLRDTAEMLVGRDDELQRLTDAWNNPAVHIVTLVAWGGVGKTALVSHWQSGLAQHGYNGADYFDWSFYSQGTREQGAASADTFIAAALEFLGGAKGRELARSPASSWDKGAQLAQFVSRRRCLLVLDGLEPLQYPPTSPLAGQLKDPALTALLKGLAAQNPGLCVVTTRERVADLARFRASTAPELALTHLSVPAGIELLRNLGVTGTAQECATLVEDVKGHALTLTLLGGFLKRAFHGDIRQRDRVKFEKADEKMDGGHAFRTMAVYEQWLLRDGDDEGRREVAVLRLMGLFDRPADAGCLAALRRETIPGLTEPLAGLADDDWEFCLSGLETAKLLTVNRDAAGALVSLDAHPDLRAYFAKQLSEKNPEAWRAGHKRLYEHLCKTTSDKKPNPTLEDLQPLYQAVAHGCQAGLQQQSWFGVYWRRIARNYKEYYSLRKLGAFGSDLSALACFYERVWSLPSRDLPEREQVVLLGNTAAVLCALGRLTESLEPMRVSVEQMAKLQDWKQAAICASNLSELELTLGEVAGAVGDAEQSVTYADRSGDSFQCESKRTTLADALHQAGRRAEAETRFREAEQMQKERQSDYPLLYSLWGFRYCDLLLAAPERAAWQLILGRRRGDESQTSSPESQRLLTSSPTPIDSCHAVSQRAAQTLKWATDGNLSLLTIALDHLTLGRAALYEAILKKSEIGNRKSEIEQAVAGLRRAGQQQYLPLGLLTRAWLRFLTGVCTGPASAQEDLDEAWEIAERGPMKLFLADIHLHRARLFFREKSYPWKSPQDDLTAAEKLINTCGYHRRNQELADARQAILGS